MLDSISTIFFCDKFDAIKERLVLKQSRLMFPSLESTTLLKQFIFPLCHMSNVFLRIQS